MAGHRLDRAEAVSRRLPAVLVDGVPTDSGIALTVRLGGLNPARVATAFRRMLAAEPPSPLPVGLTPGDFAAVRLRRDLLGGGADVTALRAWLAERAEAGGALPCDVGFRVVGTVVGSPRDRVRCAAMG